MFPGKVVFLQGAFTWAFTFALKEDISRRRPQNFEELKATRKEIASIPQQTIRKALS